MRITRKGNGRAKCFWKLGIHNEIIKLKNGYNTMISDNDGISWKIDGGIRIPISAFCIRADISYSDILGFGVTIAMGMDISFL